MMLVNIILLITTIILLYVGYTFKGIIMFTISICYEHFMCKLLKIIKAKTKNNKLNFIHEDTEFVLIFPKSLPKKDKILAIKKGGYDITIDVERYLGPYDNFFGIPVTANMLNCSELSIWKRGKFYKFKGEDVIRFTEEFIGKDNSDSE
nr:MAG: hypothetical protein DiTV3a_F21ORF2 [Diabrotica toursvirus 3a]